MTQQNSTTPVAPLGFEAKVRLIAVPMTLRAANEYVANYHRHNGRTARDGGKFAIGASTGNALVGVAIVGNPLSATYMDGFTAEVLRCCVGPDAQKGACSFLYSRCWRVWAAMGGRRLITYTLETESGASLRGAGWQNVASCPGSTSRNWRKGTRARDWQPIYGQLKLRWEIEA
jgi:hypothetical protein